MMNAVKTDSQDATNNSFIEIISNSYEEELESWLKKLQLERQKDFESKRLSSEPVDRLSSLNLRNWGQINSQFANYFFLLLREIKSKDTKLFNKYAHEANKSLLFFEFNSDLLMSEYESSIIGKHK